MGLQLRQRAALGRLEAELRDIAPEKLAALCPELDCVRDRLDAATANALERRATAAGVGADTVLITRALIDEENYVRSLAASLDLAFEPLDATTRSHCPLDDRQMLDAPAAGVIPLWPNGELCFAVAPRGLTARRLSMLGGADPSIPGRLCLTTAARLENFVRRHAEHALSERATEALQNAAPELSAGPSSQRRSHLLALVMAVLAAAALIAAPSMALLAFEVILAMVFLAWMLLRVSGALVVPPPLRAAPRLSDAELPTYTIMVSLYREVAAVPGLVASLRQLDYPPEKLDIKLVIEPDDAETRAAIQALKLGPPFSIFAAPASGPRTKPKALNAALPFARGTFTVIYDAEDRPERNQLRRALDAFRHGGEALACVQAALTIDNAADNWLTGFFAAEYAGHFDVFLPALAMFEQPLPLGGSSNHFRTAHLRAAGAWDPYNVTEDADLGLRLARFGFRTSAIESATYEEAPARLTAWLKQRTRWFKGWLQTWLVHMRDPARLRRELGTTAFITVQLIVGGNVLAALVHPVLLGLVGLWFFSTTPVWSTTGTAALFAFTILAGYAASAVLCLVGLARRGLMRHAFVLLWMPVYWLLLAVAAWRALYQLFFDPYRWEKTEHGLARTSRIGQRQGADAVIAEILAPLPSR